MIGATFLSSHSKMASANCASSPLQCTMDERPVTEDAVEPMDIDLGEVINDLAKEDETDIELKETVKDEQPYADCEAESFSPSEKEQLNVLTSLGIDEKELHIRNGGKYRFNAIHVRGVNDMSTDDILEYFKEFGVPSVEWINDCSCNVVWTDSSVTWNVLLTRSKPILVEKDVTIRKDQDKGEEEEEEVVVFTEEEEEGEIVASPTKETGSKDEVETKFVFLEGANNDEALVPRSRIDIPVPPGYWRYAQPHSKAKALLMRFALKSDKKLPGAEKRSEYYQKYGNPNYGGLKGFISTSRKRKYRDVPPIDDDDDDDDDVANANAEKEYNTKASVANMWADIAVATSELDPVGKKPKKFRMKMYADDEASKVLKRSANLKLQTNNTSTSDLRQRLDANRSRDHVPSERQPRSPPRRDHHKPRSRDDRNERSRDNRNRNDRSRDDRSRDDRSRDDRSRDDRSRDDRSRDVVDDDDEDDLRSRLHFSRSSHVVRPSDDKNTDDLRKKLDKLRQARGKQSSRSLLKVQILKVDAN